MCALGIIPSALAVLGGADLTLIPAPLWFATYGVFLVSLALCTVAFPHVPWPLPLVALALTCLSALVIVATAPEAGWLVVILICAVIACSYLLPLWATFGIVVVNTATVMASASLAGAEPSQYVFSGLISAVIQLSGVFSVRMLMREGGLRRELLLAHNHLRATQELLEESSRSQERLRISRELHDVLGHRLTALSLELEAAAHLSDGQAREHVVRARETARGLLGDVRTTVSSIRGQSDPVPLAITDLVAGLDDPVVHLRVDLPEELERAVATAVVRTVQEGLTNAIRHAEAFNLWIDARAAEGRIAVTIRDDGRGARNFTPGNGLSGMRERIEGLGGEVEFHSREGFAIRAWVPA